MSNSDPRLDEQGKLIPWLADIEVPKKVEIPRWLAVTICVVLAIALIIVSVAIINWI